MLSSITAIRLVTFLILLTVHCVCFTKRVVNYIGLNFKKTMYHGYILLSKKDIDNMSLTYPASWMFSSYEKAHRKMAFNVHKHISPWISKLDPESDFFVHFFCIKIFQCYNGNKTWQIN